MILSCDVVEQEKQFYTFCQNLLNAKDKVQFVKKEFDIEFVYDTILSSLFGGDNNNPTDNEDIILEYLLFRSGLELSKQQIAISPINMNIDISDDVYSILCSLKTFYTICLNDEIHKLSEQNFNIVHFLDICLEKVFNCSYNTPGLIRRHTIFKEICDKTKNSRLIPWDAGDRITYDNHVLVKNYYDHESSELLRNAEIELYEYGNKICNNFNSYKYEKDKKIYMSFDPGLLDATKVIKNNHNCIPSILNVLCIMRSKNIYHGDLKANNILINPYTEEVQIIDLECGRKVLKSNKITDNDMTFAYYTWDSNNPDATADKSIQVSDRVLYLYDIYKFTASIYRSELWDLILPIMRHTRNEVYLDFLVMLYQYSLMHYDRNFVTTVHEMKADLQHDVPDFLKSHCDMLIGVVNQFI